MRKKRVTILITVLLLGMLVFGISLFHKDENDTDINQQNPSMTEATKEEDSVPENISSNSTIPMQGDESGKNVDVQDVYNQTYVEEPPQQSIDNDAEIQENWGE